jgi:hypothetical protein
MRRTITVDDIEELKAIASIGKKKDYRLKDILEAFVVSKLFQMR